MSGLVEAESPETELSDFLTGFTHDPLGFVLAVYPWGEKGTPLAAHKGPRKWQRKILTLIGAKLQAGVDLSTAIKIAVASGHGIGKSALVAWIDHWARSTFEDCRVVITANTEKQLLTKTGPELAKWHRLAINRHWFVATSTAIYAVDPEHEKLWRTDLIPWSEHNTEAFAGLHNEGKRIVLIFDEASKIADKVWEVAEGALTDAFTEILWVVFGNPTRATGRFRECFRKFRHRWHTEQIDSRTVEGTNKEQLQQLVEDNGEDSDLVKVRIRGVFPSTSFKQYINQKDIDAAVGRPLPPERYQFAPIIITVDPSWEGDDEFVIGLRQGLWFEILATYPKNDNDVEMANIISRFEDEEKADAVFVDLGYGTGIISVARTLGRDWMLVNFGDKAYDEGVVNKRAEMYQAARQWLKEGGTLPNDPVLADELGQVEAVPRMDGKLLIESKKDMKARGLTSPNRADALVMSFAYPVQKKRFGSRRSGKMKSDWDPLASAAA